VRGRKESGNEEDDRGRRERASEKDGLFSNSLPSSSPSYSLPFSLLSLNPPPHYFSSLIPLHPLPHYLSSSFLEGEREVVRRRMEKKERERGSEEEDGEEG
jgi:hypothetical protein